MFLTDHEAQERMKETGKISNVVIIAKTTSDLCEKSNDEIACHLAEMHKTRACKMCDGLFAFHETDTIILKLGLASRSLLYQSCIRIFIIAIVFC